MSAWRFWVTLFDRRETASSLACFRIAIGLVTIYSLLDVGLAGLVDVLWVDYHSGGYACLGTGNWLMTWLGGATPETVHVLYGAALGSAVLVTLGLVTRVSALVAGQTYLALVFVNGSATEARMVRIVRVTSNSSNVTPDCFTALSPLLSHQPVPATCRPRYVWPYATVRSTRRGSLPET